MQGSVVVVGAGIAGVSTAFHLSELGVEDVVICDPMPPLTLTSDKSTECYRNWWPSAEMVAIMNRSIDLLEDYDRRSNRFFNLNRRGYLYVTSAPDRLEALVADGRRAEAHGAGELRFHETGTEYVPHSAEGVTGLDGADVLSSDALRRHFPYLSPTAVGAVHARRAGWMSAQQLGAWMLEEARARGVRLLQTEVTAIETKSGRVSTVTLGDGARLEARAVVNAAGPLIAKVGALTGTEVPVHSEAHFKVAFRDTRSAVLRSAPMLIWCDPQTLSWTEDERTLLAEAGRTDLLETMPAFCHGRPEGTGDSPWVVALWEYHRAVMEPSWPMRHDELYAETVLRGMSTMIPGLSGYLEHMPQPFVDGGYYTKAPDNRPLIGPLGPEGLFVCGALSGFGVMVGPAAGELAAQHVAGAPLPGHAHAFLPSRLDDPAYAATIGEADEGQL